MNKLSDLNELKNNERYLVIRNGKEHKGVYKPLKVGVGSGNKYPTAGLKCRSCDLIYSNHVRHFSGFLLCCF